MPLVTGVAVIYFGWWQQRIAREKLKHDLFDKRCKIYEKVDNLSVAIHRKVDENWSSVDTAYAEVASIAFQAPFLFGSEIGNRFKRGLSDLNMIRDFSESNSQVWTHARVQKHLRRAYFELNDILETWAQSVDLKDFS